MQLFKFEKPEPFSTIHVTNEVMHQMAEGLGFNWYSCYQPETYPSPTDEKRWAKIFAYADWLNIQFIRFGQSSGPIADEKGHFKPGHHSFDQLRRVNAWAERKGVSLLLDPFGVPKPFKFTPWEGVPLVWGQRPPNTGVEDVEGFVKYFIVPYVRHVVETMNCKAVKWFNFVNEPLTGGAFSTPPGIDNHVRYVECLAAIRKGLNEAGLSHIGNMGPDTNDLVYWPIPHMVKMGADPDPHIEAYCMHHYLSHFDWDKVSNAHLGAEPISKMIEERLNVYKDYAHAKGKPFLMTEVGTMHYGWDRGDNAGIARHDNVLLETEFILRGLDKGIDGALRWAWLNPGDQDGWWQLIETVDGSDKPLLDPFYGYTTLMRYIDRKARILKTTTSYVGESPQKLWATTVWNTDNSRSLYIVNDDYCDCKNVTIRIPAESTLTKVVNDPVRKHHKAGEIEVAGGSAEFCDTLSPMSLTVYTTRQHQADSF